MSKNIIIKKGTLLKRHFNVTRDQLRGSDFHREQKWLYISVLLSEGIFVCLSMVVERSATHSRKNASKF